MVVLCLFLPLVMCCRNNRPFDKDRYLESCAIPEELETLSESEEDSLFRKYPYSSRAFYRQAFLNSRDIKSCILLLQVIANSGYFKNDSLKVIHLLNRYYSMGLSMAEDARDVLSLTLNYAKVLPYDHRRLIGEKSFPFAKDLNDTLASQAVFRAIEGIIGPDETQISDDEAKAVLKWCNKGRKCMASAFKDSYPNYRFYLEKLAYSSATIKSPGWQTCADSLLSYTKGKAPDKAEFDRPFRDAYIDALQHGNYGKAEKYLNYYLKEDTDADSVYVPLSKYLPERPYRQFFDDKYANFNIQSYPDHPEMRDYMVDFSHFILYWTEREKMDLQTVCYVEKARLDYQQGDSDYSGWLSRAFYRGVAKLFPTTTYEFIDNYLRAGYLYNSGLVGLLTYQYDNVDARSVYDALLFIKGASEAIPPTLLKSIKQGAPPEIINYVDSIRVLQEGSIFDRHGSERNYLENKIGANVKSILEECIASYSDVRSRLKPTDIAIEFYAAPSFELDGDCSYRAAILCSNYDEPVIVNLCTGSELRDLLLKDRPYSGDSEYRLIVSPLEKYLEGKRNVYFSMDGLLYLCNLSAIPTPGGERLGQVFELKQLTSTRELVSSPDTSRYGSIALFGGIDYSGGKGLAADNARQTGTRGASSKSILRSFKRNDFSPLPFSKQEIDEISGQARLNGVEVRYFTAEDGSEKALKELSGQPLSILHIATHGFYYSQNQSREIDYLNSLNKEDNPLSRCGLLFSGSKETWKGGTCAADGEDGILFGDEIARLDFSNVDLVVLSACRSALGDIGSEGVTGLRQAFKRAGAKSILMALSNVDDKATAFFMTAFYEKLFESKDRREAFDYAVTQMKDSQAYSDPKYWAPFILLD